MLTKFQKYKKLQQGKKFQTVTIATILTIITFATSIVFAGIIGTKHDLSSSGTGTIKATAASGVTQKCVFCHTPHSSSKAGPLWNHSLSNATYVVKSQPSGFYGDPWRVSLAGQPDGSSRLCLGCHDGTVALGLLVNMPGPAMAGTVAMTGVTAEGWMPSAASGYIGTDLTGKHMISIEYDTGLANAVQAKCGIDVTYPIKDPVTIPSNDPVKLYATNHNNGLTPDTPGSASARLGVQCRSCHDPHDNTNGKFLAKGTPADWTPLCDTCHQLCP